MSEETTDHYQHAKSGCESGGTIEATDPAKPCATYACPMHQQIRQAGPGSCPICGMTLYPVQFSADVGPNHELAEMSRRFWFALTLAFPVFILEMGSHVPWLGVAGLVPERWSIWIQFALSTPVVLWAGWPFFQRGAASVRSGHLNMFTLIASAPGRPTSTAWWRPSRPACSRRGFA